MMSSRTNALRIRTPEGVTFALVLAGPVSRFLAGLLDLGCVLGLGFLASLGLGLAGLISPEFAQTALALVWFGLQLGYGIGFEWLRAGQTPGKHLLGLRVLDAEGFRLSFNQVLMRNLLRSVDFLPGAYLLGAASLLMSRRSQRLGDLAANTVVVRERGGMAPDWAGIEPGKYNSLLSAPTLVARLRQRTELQAAYLALDALLRRRELDPEARLEVFRAAADYYRERVRFPDELVTGLSDEQLVRNIVEAVFRAPGRDPALPSGRRNRVAILR